MPRDCSRAVPAPANIVAHQLRLLVWCKPAWCTLPYLCDLQLDALPALLPAQCINITPEKGLAGLFSSFFFGFWNLFCGFLIPQSAIPGWWIWCYW